MSEINADNTFNSQNEIYTIADVNTRLEESLQKLKDAAYVARKVWEQDDDALKFDLDDLSDVEDALQAIINTSEEIDGEIDEDIDDEEE